MTRSLAAPTPKDGSTPGLGPFADPTLSFPAGHLWLCGLGRNRQSQPAQVAALPIVFAIVSEPVSSGFVASLARPGSNATGFTTLEPTLGGKWLELLKEVAPSISRAAFLFNPTITPFAEAYLSPFNAA